LCAASRMRLSPALGMLLLCLIVVSKSHTVLFSCVLYLDEFQRFHLKVIMGNCSRSSSQPMPPQYISFKTRTNELSSDLRLLPRQWHAKLPALQIPVRCSCIRCSLFVSKSYEPYADCDGLLCDVRYGYAYYAEDGGDA
jgi:hypothetical protein